MTSSLHHYYIIIASLLHVLFLQARPRAINRRPPTRFANKTTATPTTSAPPTKPKDDLFDQSPPASPIATKLPSPPTKRKIDLFGNDDLFDDLPKTNLKSSKPSKPLDDLFGPSEVKNPLQQDDLFGDLPTVKAVKQVEQVKSVKKVKPVEEVDDLFGEPVKKPVKQVEDDLFDKPVKKLKPVKQVEDDLFNDRQPKPKPVKPVGDDLFDEPVKKPKPVQPDTKLPDGLFNLPSPPLPPTEIEEELFASLGPTPRKVTPTAKKTTPKSDDTPSSIFSDEAATPPKPVDDIFASSPPGIKPNISVSSFNKSIYGT